MSAASESTDPASTIEALIAAWRELDKPPELAELIAAYGEATESRQASELRNAKPKQPEWFAQLDALPAHELGALLVSLPCATALGVTHRIEKLLEREPDPRIVDAVHQMVMSVPWTSTSARKVWTRSFKLLREWADPRSQAMIQQFDDALVGQQLGRAGGWMSERMVKITSALAVAPPPRAPGPDHAALIARARAVTERAERSAEREQLPELWALACREQSDAALLVLADALQAEGDPRGELIMLQLRDAGGELDRKGRTRMNKLLREHRDVLLGAFEPIVLLKSIAFERGALAACTFKQPVAAGALERAMAEPWAGLLRRVEDAPVELVLDPRMGGLREAGILRESTEALLTHPSPLGLRALDLWLGFGQLELVEDCSCLPELQSLSLRSNAPTAYGLCKTTIGRQVEHLHFMRLNASADLLHAALERREGPNRVSTSADLRYATRTHVHFELRRDAEGELHIRFDLRTPPSHWDGATTQMLRTIGELLDNVRPLAPDPASVELRSTNRKPNAEQLERARKEALAHVSKPERVRIEVS